MCSYIKKICACRYLALTASLKIPIGIPIALSQKRLGMNKFVRTKSATGSKFSKIFFEHLYTGWIVVVHLCFSFSLCRQMAPQQIAKCRTAFFWSILYQFETSFLSLLGDQICFATH